MIFPVFFGEPSSCCQIKVGYVLAQDTEALKRVYEEIKDFKFTDESIDFSEKELRNVEQIYKQLELPEPNRELIKSYVLKT